jgi:hypothetical protein
MAQRPPSCCMRLRCAVHCCLLYDRSLITDLDLVGQHYGMCAHTFTLCTYMAPSAGNCHGSWTAPRVDYCMPL